MNLVQPPSLRPGDDLDGLLRAFFRSQIPHPWPALRTPRMRASSAARPASSRGSLIRSRYALAASVTLLLLGSLFLPGRLTRNLEPSNVPSGTPISSDDVRQKMKKDLKIKDFERKHKSTLGTDEGDLDGFELSPIK
jgi:hypothetical protein